LSVVKSLGDDARALGVCANWRDSFHSQQDSRSNENGKRKRFINGLTIPTKAFMIIVVKVY